MLRQVAVEDLQPGMYVAELDRPWTDTPFLFQGFELRTADQLEILRKYCSHVYVDPERSTLAGALPPPPTKPDGPNGGVRGTTEYPEKARIEAEYARADYIQSKARELLEDALRSLQGSDILDARRLSAAASLITESVVRNPDALLLVNQLREKGGDIVSRALDVSVYMVVFGRFLQRPREELETLGLAGLLMDIGKIKLPNALLRKADRLSPEELKLARSHVARSVEILRGASGLVAGVANIAALHHERQDGSGYPRALKGPDIGLHGSMAGIVDTFDALTAVRPYANQIPPSRALGMLHKERGAKFDGELVEQFIRCIGVFSVGSVVELNSGEVGIVLSQNATQRLKPRVMVVLGPDGQRMYPYKILDLARDPKATATEPYIIRRTLESERVRIDPHELFL
jgi:HD-GYP domain-containing protein (c-di-GMP phosphodiesterase class II)